MFLVFQGSLQTRQTKSEEMAFKHIWFWALQLHNVGIKCVKTNCLATVD